MSFEFDPGNGAASETEIQNVPVEQEGELRELDSEASHNAFMDDVRISVANAFKLSTMIPGKVAGATGDSIKSLSSSPAAQLGFGFREADSLKDLIQVSPLASVAEKTTALNQNMEMLIQYGSLSRVEAKDFLKRVAEGTSIGKAAFEASSNRAGKAGLLMEAAYSAGMRWGPRHVAEI